MGRVVQEMTTMDMPINHTTVRKLVADCYEEEDVDKKVQILYKINSLLPESYRINIPSLITNDYIDIVLYRIEENIHSVTTSA
jgi:predicted DNA-binding protein (UPF0278 family)